MKACTIAQVTIPRGSSTGTTGSGPRRAASGTAGASAPPAHASAALVRAAQVRDRLMLEVPDEQLRERVEQLVSLSYNNVYTRAYDEFQRWSNGIAC